MRTARRGAPGGLAGYFAVLAIGAVGALVFGIVTGEGSTVAAAAPMVAVFGWCAWLLNPRRRRRQSARPPDLQDRFFEHLGIRWFLDPERHERWAGDRERR